MRPSDLIQGTLDVLILKSVATEPRHGWAIAKRIQAVSGDVLQNINPWNWFFKLNGSQVGLFNINLGRSADPELEQEILDEVGSSGRQIGRISDVLGILLRHIDLQQLDDAEKTKIAAFTTQLAEIERMKSRRKALIERGVVDPPS